MPRCIEWVRGTASADHRAAILPAFIVQLPIISILGTAGAYVTIAGAVRLIFVNSGLFALLATALTSSRDASRSCSLIRAAWGGADSLQQAARPHHQ
jgi:hypothetical protein